MKIQINVPMDVGTVITVDGHPFELIAIDENSKTWRTECVGCGKVTTYRTTGTTFGTRYTCEDHKRLRLRALRRIRKGATK